MVMMMDRDGGGGGGGRLPTVTPTPPPTVTPTQPPTWQPPPTTPTGTPVTTLKTGGPQPPTTVQTPQQPLLSGSGYNNTIPVQTVAPQAVPGGPAPVPAQATSSPIQMMDWQARLAQGNQNAMTREVGANETVAHQMDQLADSGSAYINHAQDRARNEASARGMMMSSMAAGAGARAAIDASLPIAQQDAQTYGRTASENMAAVNADRMQDQSIFGNLTGQELGIRANLDESERSRGFSALENQRNRQFQEREMVMTQNWQGSQANADRIQQARLQNSAQGAQLRQAEMNNAAQIRNTQIQTAHDAAMQTLNRNTQLTMQERQYLQERFGQYQTAMQNQSVLLSQTIASIYNNPNLSASQQAAAVANATKVYQSMFQSYAATMAAGLPKIFATPYTMR